MHVNELSGPLPAVWSTPNLRVFRAEENRLSGQIPEGLLRQPLLEQVYLQKNELTGPIPTALSPRLKALFLFENRLSGAIPGELGRLDDLTDLRLQRNQLAGPIPAALAGARSLQVLRLDHNRLSGPVPAGLAERLMVFDVSDNPGLEATR